MNLSGGLGSESEEDTVTYPLTRTGVETDIEASNPEDGIIHVELDVEGLYDALNFSEATDVAVDATPEGIQAVLGKHEAHLQLDIENLDSRPGEAVVNYIDDFDEGLASLDSVTDVRNQAVLDAVERISSRGLGADWEEELPYSDLGVDVTYHGTQGDENFSYSFDEFVYDDFDGELQKAALEAVGPEEVSMELENPKEASVSVEADDITDAVQNVYDHLEAVDQEYAEQSDGAYSRRETADELDDMIEAFEE